MGGCGRDVVYLVTLCCALLSLLLLGTLHLWHWKDLNIFSGMMKELRSEQWNRYSPPCLTSTDLLFYVWAVIYIYQVAWLIYASTLLARRSTSGYFLSRTAIIAPSTFLCFTFAMATNACWFLLWQKADYIKYSAAASFAGIVVLYSSLIASVYGFSNQANRHDSIRTGKDRWLVTVFVHNGIAAYTSWMTLSLLYTIGVALKQEQVLDNDVSCQVSHGLSLGYIVVLFIIDVMVPWTVPTFIFSQYIVLIPAFCGSILVNIRPDGQFTINLILSVALLSVLIVYIISKIVVSVIKCRSYSRNNVEDQMSIKSASLKETPQETPQSIKRMYKKDNQAKSERRFKKDKKTRPLPTIEGVSSPVMEENTSELSLERPYDAESRRGSLASDERSAIAAFEASYENLEF